MIKVLLADDHPMFLEGLNLILNRNTEIEVVGEALDGEQVLAFLEKQTVDVVVLDIEMPNLNGVEATKIIKKKHPKVKVLILTMYSKKIFILKLMANGANGYILKNKSKEELVTAIHNVHNGTPHFSLEILTLASKAATPSEILEDVHLTEREIDVLKLIAAGKTSKEISAKLHIAETTVNTHRRNLLAKLDLPNDKLLVHYAISKGHIDLLQ